MILLPVLALVLGLALGLAVRAQFSGLVGIYVSLAVLAGLDSLLGGIRSALEGKFQTLVFVSGFASNIAIAIFMAWFGDNIGLNLYFAAVLVMGWRVFTNLSLIRRHVLTLWGDARAKRKSEAEHAAKQAQAAP
jgi:small basic protein